MKIYNEIVFDVDGNVIYEDSYEYSGDVMLCQEGDPLDLNNDGGINILDLSTAIARGKDPVVIQEILDIISAGGREAYETKQDEGGTHTVSNEMLIDLPSAALTANPLPSIPAMSNVGAAPFSGSVNWNSIPGGFQPLPQTAGGRKKLYQLSQFHGGINQKSSPRDISDQECQEATNITVSQVGRIKLLGDIKSTSSGITSTTLSDVGVPSPGYGLFVFKSAYSLASTVVQGNYTINVSQDGGVSQLTDGSDTNALTISNTATHVAPTWYVSGNGLYACNANLLHTGAANDTRKAAIAVYRKDINGDVAVSGWKAGEALIGSPVFNNSDAENTVGLHLTDHPNYASTAITENGQMIVTCDETATAGNWEGVYTIYVSWLFDGGVETGLSSIGDTGDIDKKTLDFNVVVGLSHASATPLGGDKRIEGARVYFRKANTVERFMLAEIRLPDGVMGALDSTFTPWHDPGDDDTEFDLEENITFKTPPEIHTYYSKNLYYATEVYDESPNATGTAPASHNVRYRTATVGANGSVFIGCYMFRDKVFMDRMLYSMPGKPGVFPEYNVFDSPSSDGTPIIELQSFQDKILQFKENALYIINISNPSQFYTEASFRDCGIMNPCQAFNTSFGVIFANVHGCFIYDGNKVISLSSGKLTGTNWGISEGSVVDTVAGSKDGVNVPCVGYDPRSQNIIVLKDIGDNATDTGAWVYNMTTQSWTEGTSMITNTNADRHTNFIISPNGYLSIQQDAAEALKTYNIGAAATQAITYWTKDLDFGLPSQTKYLYKVYITYKGDADELTVKWGADGHDRTYSEVADLYSFSQASHGGTEDLTPLLDKNSAADLENWHVATLYPDNSTEAGGWYSMSIYMNGTVDNTFEINDISILYRVRPIK